MARRITQENLGAWLLRCNPKNAPELRDSIVRGGHRINRWCVADNYRSRMMSAGDAVVFWVSGDGRQLTRGIWGSGYVLGVSGLRAATGCGDVTDMGTAGRHDRPTAAVHIPLRPQAISDQALRANGINDLEVQVQPQGSNPSWISRHQLARLAAAFPLSIDPESGYPAAAVTEEQAAEKRTGPIG